jgi:hypothetical protein
MTIFFFMSGVGLTADEAVIQELQTDVSATKGKADTNAAEIQSLKGGLPAEQAAREAADAALQGTIDAEAAARALADSVEIQARSAEDAAIWNYISQTADVTPPAIIHDMPTELYTLETQTFNFSLTDNIEVGYLAIQFLNESHSNQTFYAAPNNGFAEFQITPNLQEGNNDLVLLAADIYGNISKYIHSIYFDLFELRIDGSVPHKTYRDSSGRLWGAKEGMSIELLPGSSSEIRIQYTDNWKHYSTGFARKIILFNDTVAYEECFVPTDGQINGNYISFVALFPIDTSVDGNTFNLEIYSRSLYTTTNPDYFGVANYHVTSEDLSTGETTILNHSVYADGEDYRIMYQGPDYCE